MERSFHVVGATTEKALEASAVLVLGTTSLRVSEEERSDFVGTDGGAENVEAGCDSLRALYVKTDVLYCIRCAIGSQ